MMALADKYIGLWISDDAARRMFGFLNPPSEPFPDRRWLITGHITDETVGVGIWVVIEHMSSQPDEQTIEMTKDAGSTLIRWEWIEGAVIWDAKPTEPIGFLPRGLQG